MHFRKKSMLLVGAILGPGGLVRFVSASSGSRGTDSDALLTRRDTVLKNGTTISKSFTGATLFDGEINLDGDDNLSTSIVVVCTDCYITGQVTTELNISPPNSINNNNATSSVNLTSVAYAFVNDVTNITKIVFDDVVAALKNETAADLKTPDLATLKALFHDVTRPTVDVDFALAKTSSAANLIDLPEYQFKLTLDAFDMFVQTQMAASGSATYTLNLFTSESALGLRVSSDLELGVVLTVDLIMSVQGGSSGGGGVKINTGFHLRMDDGLELNVDLFGNNVSDIVFNGGTFEFLPVTVSVSEVTLNAVLRVGVHAGIVLSSDEFTFDGLSLTTYSAGVETIVFADVANLTLNVAAAGSNALSEVTDGNLPSCGSNSSSDLVVEEIFGFDIGAEAGASIEIGDFLSWGVGPTTMLPVFYTTVAQCVGGGDALTAVASTPTATHQTISTAAGNGKRAAAAATTSETTTVISTTFIYSAIACQSLGLMNCPASLQTTAVTTATSTTTLTVEHGSQATWPAPTATTPLTKVAAFGDNAKSIGLSASGTPSSFVPPTSTIPSSSLPSSSSSSTKAPGISIGDHHLTTAQEHIVIGVTVGVGVPFVVCIVAVTM